ncbi:TPA: hypothetical protein N0F65_007704 [Lagenidium giganteum]|uniref:Splicing factor Cactin n=1 Tax=Lagenidium giganteum TaxID=4803 RepID=A0AAV2Z7F2_9STRA|nr:TPA: hypothetical protein N0F65_007704 [Lagenidium giganteum]
MGSSDHKKSKKSKKSSSSKRRRRDSSDSEEEERKLRKQSRKAEKMLATFGYTNETNPFGDTNLSQPFVWGKKYEAAGRAKPSEKELKKQQLARAEEIRKARKRREEREAEKAEFDRLKQEELRLRDAEQYDDWQQKEEEFHLAQTKVRSKMRIKERREKPIDLLAKNLLLVAHAMSEEEEDDFLNADGVRVERRKPFEIVEVLSMDELEELRDSIVTFLDLEGQAGANREFWELMMLITKDRIRRLRLSQNLSGTERGAIHDSVNRSIAEMLQGKAVDELNKLARDVEQTIASAETGAAVDVEYWEEVAHMINVYKARDRLNQLHEKMLDQLGDVIQAHEERAEARQRQREAMEQDNQEQAAGMLDNSAEARAMEKMMNEKGLEESEERLGAAEEVDLHNLPDWSEKFKPRKPRYFNRVKTGYDWNKYNQTHYDHDNPPPKVVQGYKFNLFYPDLIDKTTAPKFFLEKTSNTDFCIIRFSAGPPYQDIAFKIVNREWEYSHKRGFKSVFERGILHLYFNFKRHRYRR